MIRQNQNGCQTQTITTHLLIKKRFCRLLLSYEIHWITCAVRRRMTDDQDQHKHTLSFLKSVLSFSKPQLSFQKIETPRILLSIAANCGCSSYIHTYPIYSRLHLHLVLLVYFPHWSWWSLRVPGLRTASSSQGARCPGKASDRSYTWWTKRWMKRNQWAGDEPCQTKLVFEIQCWIRWSLMKSTPQYIELGDEPPKLKVLACFFSHGGSISLMLRFSCLLPSAAGFPSL